MLEGVTEDRIKHMTANEVRWLDNIKKAFLESDEEFRSGKPEDRCLEELFKAIDTATTLQRSLQGKGTSSKNNAKRFADFLYEEVPRPEANGLKLELSHARNQTKKTYGFAELVYEIRCMIHENENLNVAEGANYHVLLDWKSGDSGVAVRVANGRAIVNGRFLWGCLRQMLSKFITLVDSIHTLPETGRVGARIDVPLESVRPDRNNAT
jgi:hypothetical protein